MGILERFRQWMQPVKAKTEEEPRRCPGCGEVLRFDGNGAACGMGMVECACGFSAIVDLNGELDAMVSESAAIVEMLSKKEEKNARSERRR